MIEIAERRGELTPNSVIIERRGHTVPAYIAAVKGTA